MRSLLFVPADSEPKLENSLGSGADVLIFDLEDAVAGDRKAAAREILGAFLARTRATATPAVCVRINDLDTAFWQDDLATVMPHAPDFIMLPKARGGSDVRLLAGALERLEPNTGLSTGLIVLATERPVSLLRMDTYVEASTRLKALTWGAEDLSAELGAHASRTPDGAWTSPYRLARDLCLMTAAAAGITALDTVYTEFRDTQGLAREAAEAARDGFTGKLAIHPAQVPIINDAFTPDDALIANALKILDAFRDSQTGVVSLDGRMIDEPHRRQAERVLARARQAGKTIPATAVDSGA